MHLAPLLLALLAQASPRPPGRFDAADRGYLDATIADKALPINAALADAAAYVTGYEKANPGYSTKGIVHVPATNGPGWTRTSIRFPRGNVELVGDGPGSRIMGVGTSGHPVVTIGFPDVSANGFTPGAAVRPDLFGVLDSTAAPAPGRRWGLAIGPCFLVQYGGAFDLGGKSPTNNQPDSWSETSTFTLEVAMAPAAGATTLPARCSLGTPGVFTLWQPTPGVYQFYLMTRTSRSAPPTRVNLVFAAPNPDGLKRITVQGDLSRPTGAVFGAWVDGVQVPFIKGSPLGAPAVPSTIAPNVNGAFSAGIGSGPTPFGQQTPPFNLHGLCVSRTLRYAVGAVGSPQARADGVTPVVDGYRYFPSANVGANQPAITDAGYIAALALDEHPALAGRAMRVASASDYSSIAYLGDPNLYGAGIGEGAQGGNAIRGLTIRAGLYGAAVLTAGGVLGLVIEDCDLAGGPYAVATMPMGANYGHVMRRTRLSGWESAFNPYFGGWRLREIDVNGGGRAAIRAVACSLDVQDISVWASSPNQEYFAQLLTGEYGGTDSFRNVMIDNEDLPYSRAIFLMDRHPYGTTRLRIEDCYASQVGKGVPYVKLNDVAGPPNSWTWQPAILAASGLRCDGAVGAAVECDGPAWKGSVRDSVLTGGVVGTGTYGPAAVVYVDPLAAAVLAPAAAPK